MKFVLSTIAWVESIAKKDIERVWGKIDEVTDRLVIFSWDAKLMVSVNLWSRVGNKLYILLEEKEKVIDFDNFFETIKNISFKKYFKKNLYLDFTYFLFVLLWCQSKMYYQLV